MASFRRVPLPKREIEICQRLRAFREATLIPRSRFALTIGIGSERLASYETARVPIRYGIFKLITTHYFLSPFWLGSGDPVPARLNAPFDDASLGPIDPRALFSGIFDAKLKPIMDHEWPNERAHSRALLTEFREFYEGLTPAKLKKFSREDLEEWARVCKRGYELLNKSLRFDADVKSRLRKSTKRPGDASED